MTEVVSLDGRRFRAQIPVSLGIQLGDLVVLRGDDHELLGQLDALRLTKAQDDPIVAEGDIVGAFGTDGQLRRGLGSPFVGGTVERAGREELARLQSAAGATVPVASVPVADGDAPIQVRPRAFNRHTFLCGQSGSGKTYTLGVFLEQLLLQTRLRIVVIDPNGDFVRLGEQREDAPHDEAAGLASQKVTVLRSRDLGGELPLLVKFPDLQASAQAAVMRLDPVLDREEYGEVLRYEQEAADGAPLSLERLRGPGDTPEQERLHQRLRNLGVLDWQVWARGGTPATEVIDGDQRATVLDLSGFTEPGEATTAALATLDHLWQTRHERRPTLIVIDEAHNICSAKPDSPVQARATERLIQIAAEGRKYGLWLLLSTQRPSKIHPNVLSQCDNLVLMRMNSPNDISDLGSVFGFAPREMVAASPRFAMGEVLLAGMFVPVPALARTRTRLTPEGGADVAVPLP